VIPDAHRQRAPEARVLGTAVFRELDLAVLVTTFSDGTGEVAYRERRWDTWSAPVALVVAS
jgi:hypothetical protein